MAFQSQEHWALPQRIADNSATQLVTLGTIIRAYDPDYGVGEFIYLKGVGSTVVGSWVTYNADDWTTALIVADALGPVAVAMSASVAAEFGWYQISGKAVTKATTALGNVADNGDLYMTATAGEVDGVVVTGDRIWQAKAASINTTLGFCDAEIHRPFIDNAVNSGAS